MKRFAYSDRAVQLAFFDEDPVVITAFISDEMDKKILESGKLIAQADKSGTVDGRTEKYAAALALLIGEDKTEKLLSRAPERDSFACMELWNHIVSRYREQKAKNLGAPAR